MYGSGQPYVILEDGKIYAWGDNSYGKLGVGSSDTAVSKPTSFKLPDCKKIIYKYVNPSYLSDYTYVILDDNTMYAWGNNERYNLGVGSEASVKSFNTPTKVTTSDGKTEFKLVNNISSSSFATGIDGTLYVWGYNQDGMLGIGSCENQTVPTPVVMPAGVTKLELIENGGNCSIYYSTESRQKAMTARHTHGDVTMAID